MAKTTVAIYGILAVSYITSVTADIRCYSCTSYMSQCKDIVDDNQGDVFKTNCNSKCFVRRGEDGAIYRGCFDGFMEVNDLKYSYAGCKNQTWNRKSLEWCMCDTDLCNNDMMGMRQSNTAKDTKQTSDNFHKYDYNDIAYDIKEQKFNVYDDLKYDSKYDYNDVTYDAQNKKYLTSNKASSYMDRYAREGPVDANYDESLFGINEQNYQDNYKEIKYMSPENPSYPPQYELKYFGPGSETLDRYETNIPDSRVVDRYDAPDNTYQITNDYRQQLYYPHQPQYARETGPEYNYNTPPQPYNDPHQEESTNYVSARLATKIRCNKSGYYQNPNDCRQFVACLLDPYSKTPIMHVMKCPGGLVWDNKKKICMEYSTTCNVVVSNRIEDGLREKEDKLDITGFESNTVNEQHGEGDSESAHGTEDGANLDSFQDNTYGVSGDIKHDVYSDVYGVNNNDDSTDVVF